MKHLTKTQRPQPPSEAAMHRSIRRYRKYHAWLALGLTGFGLSFIGLGLAGPPSLTSAHENQNTIRDHQYGSVIGPWVLRPVSQIEAQITASNKVVYNVQWGDTLSTISEALNSLGFTTSVDRLAAINHIKNVDLIEAGAKLYLQDNARSTFLTTNGQIGTAQFKPANPIISAPKIQPQNINAQTPPPVTQSQATQDDGNAFENNESANSNLDAAEIAAKLKALKEARDQTAAEKEAAEKTKQTLEAKITAMLNAKNEASLTQLRSKRDKLQITINTAKAKINAANLALTKILKAYEEAKQAAIASDSYVTGKQAKVGTIKQKIHDLTAQISSLHSQLEAINQDAQTAKDQLTQAKVATLKKDLWTAQQTLNDYEEQLEVARQQLEQAQQTQLNAAANLITAKKNLDQVQAEIKSANVQLQIANDRLVVLPATSQAINSEQAEALKTELQELDRKIDRLDEQLKTFDEQVAYWQHQLNNTQHTIDNANLHTGHAISTAKAANITDTQEATHNAQVTIDRTKANLPQVHVPVNINQYETIQVDEQGHQVSDLSNYHLLNTSEPVKSVQTMANGDTVTTYTTTATYHRIRHFCQTITKNIDENGTLLTSTSGYTQVTGSEKTITTQTTADNGDVTTTITTTIMWKPIPVTPAHQTKYVTKNVDESGNVITPSAAFHWLSANKRVRVSKLQDGTILTTVTVTNVYHRIRHFAKTIIKNVDENGTSLTSTTGYVQVGTPTKIATDKVNATNGDVTTTTTAIVTWKKQPIHRDVYETIAQDENGAAITPSAAYHLLTTQSSRYDTKDSTGTITTHHVTLKIYHRIQHFTESITQNIDEQGRTIKPSGVYHLLSSKDTIKDVIANNGDVTTTTTTVNIYHKIVHKIKKVTINQDQKTGEVLTSTEGYSKVPNSSYTSSHDVIAKNGDICTTITTTILWKKKPTHITERWVRNVDEAGKVIDSVSGYHLMSTSQDTKETVQPDGTQVTTITTTNVYHKIDRYYTYITINKDEAGNILNSALGYEQVGEPRVTVEEHTAENGDIYRTTTTITVWRKPEKNATETPNNV